MGKRLLGFTLIGAVLASLTFLFAACEGGDKDAAGETVAGELHLVAYPGLGSAYQDALEPAFEKSLIFEHVEFGNSFGESSDQGRAVSEGAPASILHFEQAGEMEQLVEEGIVDASWDEQPYGGMAHDTVIVFVVRKGNPKQIHSLRDILSGDLDVVIPNPFRSDTGRWALMDVYATLIHERKTEAQALAGVRRVLEKAVAQPDGAAEAFEAFVQGQGDVLLTYESQAIRAVEAGKGRDFQFLVPHQTFLVETPIAVTKDAPEPIAREFLEFAWSEEGQILWSEEGYRPVESTLVDQERFFPRRAFKIARFGGWADVNEEFFDPETGSIAAIEQELSVPTDG
jgi:sulfate/thiosulfate transport system substrate-binding protein